MKKTSLPKQILLVWAALFCCATVQGQALHEISTVGSTFVPASITIQAGDTVQWTNTGMGFHNVAASDGSFTCANGCTGSGGNGSPANNVWTFKLVFNTPGTINYYCQIHGTSGGSGMAGFITVEAAPPGCTGLSDPAHTSTDVPVTTNVTWGTATGSPTGYRLDLGLSGGGTEITDNHDNGNSTTYDYPGVLPNNTVVYVFITPYNATGDATECPEEFFQTEPCTNNLAVTADVVSGTFQSIGDLTAQNATIAPERTVIFASNTGITLQANFTVEAGSEFDALIQACGN